MASKPLGALALIALGYRSLSLSATAHGPVKAMILDLDAKKAEAVHHAAARCAGRQRLDPAEADGIRGSRGAVVVARLCPAQHPPSAFRHEIIAMLPEAKLDILLAHHASLEAELLGQVNSEKYVQITRELAELNPLIDAVKAYRATRPRLPAPSS